MTAVNLFTNLLDRARIFTKVHAAGRRAALAKAAASGDIRKLVNGTPVSPLPSQRAAAKPASKPPSRLGDALKAAIRLGAKK